MISENYYKILNLRRGPQDEKKNITDEDVEKAYNDMKKQIMAVFKNAKTEKEKLILTEIKNNIEKAYQTLKTEQSRMEYNEYLKNNENANETKKEVEIGQAKKEIKFIPIYKGELGKLPPQKNEDDDGR